MTINNFDVKKPENTATDGQQSRILQNRLGFFWVESQFLGLDTARQQLLGFGFVMQLARVSSETHKMKIM